MNRRIRSALAGLAATIVAATSLSLVTASPVAAFGQETFGCRIAPGTIFTWEPLCVNSMPASGYNVGFAVLNTSGSYTYSWNITGSYQSVLTGCTSTSSDCALSVPGGRSDSELYVTVTYSQNGQSANRFAHAYVRGYCGSQLC